MLRFSACLTGGRAPALQACLQTDPALRPTCQELLAFPYFAAAPSWFSPEFHRHQVSPKHGPAAPLTSGGCSALVRPFALAPQFSVHLSFGGRHTWHAVCMCPVNSHLS